MEGQSLASGSKGESSQLGILSSSAVEESLPVQDPEATARPNESQELDRLISVSRTSLETLPNLAPDLLRILPAIFNPRRSLFQALWTRYERNEQIEDLREAIDCGNLLLEQAQENTVERGFLLHTLGCQMSALYEATNEAVHLDVAITLGREAIEEPFGSDFELCNRLGSLSYSLSARFGANRDPKDLDESISLGIKSLEKTPPDATALRLGSISNLGARYVEKYHLDHKQETKLEAERLCHQVISSEKSNSNYKVVAMVNLADLYIDEYELSSSIDDVEDAIRPAKRVVDDLPTESPLRGQVLARLGSKLRSVYQQTKNIKYLQRAIALYEEVGHLPTSGRSNQIIMLVKYAMLLKEYAEETKSPEDIDHAIDQYLLLVQLQDLDHQSHKMMQRSLQALYDLKFA